MKIVKKVLALVMALAMVLALASCAKSDNAASDGNAAAETTALKVGAILVGDETEGYTLAHMQGIEGAVAELKNEGINVEYEYKKKVPESDEVAKNANDLIADGCTLVITNSYGHQFYLDDVIKANPEVNFVAMTGDLAAKSGQANYFNAFTSVYESRYVSGVVAGMKLKEEIDQGILTPEKVPTGFDENGNIKLGYVGAFNYAEVVSGYTAYYLGVKSIVPNVVMTVQYTNSWFSEEREAAVAESLMGMGCVMIAQHADSTGAPAAVEAAKAANPNLVCNSIGYNVSMTDVAPNAALTSASNNWKVYYKELFKAAATGAALPQDWAKGYSDDAVMITDLGQSCAAGTAEKVAEVEAQLKAGTLKVFNAANFTVGGQNLTSYTTAYGMEDQECMVTENGVTYFNESTLRSAPYFDIRIDGITEIESTYEAEA